MVAHDYHFVHSTSSAESLTLNEIEYASPLSDISAVASGDRQRRRLEAALDLTIDSDAAAITDALVCWQWVLHWISDSKDCQATAIIDSYNTTRIVVSSVNESSTYQDLKNSIVRQLDDTGTTDAVGVGLSEAQCQVLDCLTVRLSDDELGASRSEVEVIITASTCYIDCAAARFSESYQRTLITLWQTAFQLCRSSERKPLAEQTLFRWTESQYEDIGLNGRSKVIFGNLIDRFKQNVEKSAEKTAVVDGIVSLSYRELDRLSSHWLAALVGAGATAGETIGLAFDTRHQMVVGQLAVLKLGGIFVPMDAGHPQSRLVSIAHDTGMQYLMTEQNCLSDLTDKLLNQQTHTLHCLVAEDIPISGAATRYHCPANSDDTAYILFTSGSTGKPKGVKVSHGNLINFVEFMSKYVSSEDVSTQFAPFTFDASVAEIHSSVLNGGTLVMLSKSLIDKPVELQSYLNEQKVSFSALPPSYAKHLSPQSLPHLKTLLTAGSAPDHEVVRLWQPHLTYINAYGPTETTILSTLWEADRIVHVDEPIAMGSPIDNTRVRIVNGFDHILPAGFIGELIIGGSGVTQGYINRETETHQKYFESENTRWYRSGDLACLNSYTQLVFCGRADNQVKLRGHRLELGEVELALKALPEVDYCAACVSDKQATTQLYVFCVGTALAESALRDRLCGLLPQWAMPNRIFWLDDMPLTINGKTDYKALSQQIESANDSINPVKAELTPLQRQVAKIWESVLHVSAITSEVNFIHIGGDSLTALMVAAALRREGIYISSSQLLSRPILREFVDTLTECNQPVIPASTEVSPATSESLITLHNLPPSVTAAYPLTDMQKTMYNHQQQYQVWMYYEFPRPLQVGPFQRALERIVSWHDCLRTCVYPVGQEALQIVLRDWQPDLILHDVGTGDMNEYAEQCIQQARAKKVSVEGTPSVGFDVIHGDRDTFLVLLSIHHINHDGWTINLLVDGLFKEYLYQLTETTSGATRPLAGMDVVVQAQLQAAGNAELEQYWANRPWQNNFCRLSTSNTATENPEASMQLVSCSLDAGLCKQVRQASRDFAVTSNVIWMSAFAILLRYLGGALQVRFGVLHSGRMESIEGIETIAGCCVNSLPMVINIEKGDAQRDILESINTFLAQMRDGAAFPVSRVDALARETIETELFECLFNIESDNYLNVDDRERPQLNGGYEATNASLNFSIIEQKNEFGLRIGFMPDRFDHFYVTQLVEVYQRCVTQLVENTSSAWNEPVNLYGPQSQSLLRQWNNTGANCPEGNLWELFVSQVEQNRYKEALWEQGEICNTTYTYQQLLRRSESLSSTIRQKLTLSDGKRTTVGLYSERSASMVLAILALTRLGCSYLPLDIRCPAFRRQHQLSDSGCSLVLVQRESDAPWFRECGYSVLSLADEDNYTVPETPEPESRPLSCRDQTAYIMYTSGSTGKPKGVLINQKSIISLVMNNNYAPLTTDDRVLLTGAPVFDATTYEIWGTLLNGASLSIVGNDVLLDTEHLCEVIQGRSISTLWLTSSLFNRHVVQRPDLFANVKQLLVGGDALSVEHIRLAREHNPGLCIINGYGPTENTTFSVCYRMEADMPLKPGKDIPIGMPIQNSTAHIVNDAGQEVPVGALGELWVGGDGVAAGYLNQPDLTQERFVEDCFGQSGARLYKTGDCAQWNQQGLIEFYGRIDDQVKIRGFRVEPGEIEYQLSRHRLVSEAKVIVRNLNEQLKQIIAYVVAASHSASNDNELAAELRNFAIQELPEYMVPAHIVVLDYLPLNQNGKLDRASLQEPDLSTTSEDIDIQVQTDTERFLLRVLSDILGYPCRNVESDFFRLGATSLDAVKFVAEIRSAFAVDTAVCAIFNAGSVRELASTIDQDFKLQQNIDSVDIESMNEEELDRYISQLAKDQGGLQ